MSEIIDICAPIDQQEGTFVILKSWLKSVGVEVKFDEPVAELETDKVALEVVSPADGVITEIIKGEDTEVIPGELLARMTVGAKVNVPTPSKPQESVVAEKPKGDIYKAPAAKPTQAPATQQKNKELRLSPSVRRLCKQHDIDATSINGTGHNGRVTREDTLKYIKRGGGVPSADTMSTKGEILKLTPMRKSIARHMVKSVTDAPHVTAVFEAGFSAIMEHRKSNKANFAEKGVNLTYTSYIVAATAAALTEVPEVNSSFKGDYVEVYEDLNIGVGTALEGKGLIVPVIKRAQDLDLVGIATALQDLTERAHQGKLTQNDIKGGTFSISNHGVSGSLLASPIIINQPQAAILGVGKLEKRVVVVEENGQDIFKIKPMAYVTLTIDHRVLDGFQTNKFLSKFVKTLESWK